MKPYLDSFVLNTSAALLETPENFENFSKLFPKKHLKETVQAVTYLKKCKLKTELGVLYCIVLHLLYCIVLYCTVLYGTVFKGRSTKASGVTTFLQFLIESNLKVDFRNT
jgi:hypothetical protein